MTARRRRSVVAVLALAAGLVAFFALRAREKTASPPVVVDGLRPPDVRPFTVVRGNLVAEGRLDDVKGGRVTTSDGLILDVPPGGLGQPTTFKVYSATAPAPAQVGGVFGATGGGPLELLRAWDVDAGPESGFYPGEVQVTVDVPAGGAVYLPAISIDSTRWSFPPFQARGDKIVFTTRHFSALAVFTFALSAHPAYWAALGVVSTAFLYFKVYPDLPAELPAQFNEDAPFVSSGGASPSGFELWWSRKLPGADPSTGFKDKAGFEKELDRIAGQVIRDREQDQAEGIVRAAADVERSVYASVDRARHEFLMPAKVKEIEEALVYARQYIESRGFKRPCLTLPVYVVRKAGRNDGSLYNPWLGRRYVVIGANLDRNDVYATALHELFHHYQTGYVWFDRKEHVPLMEASALLLEREAAARYKSERNVTLWTDIAELDVYRDGLDGAGGSSEDLQKHGYGLSWFLEYLRDGRTGGKMEDFHVRLFGEWASRWTGALHKGLVWAAGGDDEKLGAALTAFAQDAVLTGMPDGTTYGLAYKTSVFKNPYGEIDLASKPYDEAGDDRIKPWSIQFYKLKPPGRPKAKLVVVVPAEWSAGPKPGRAVFFRMSTQDAGVQRLQGRSTDTVFAASFAAERCLYVVDTGQTGSGWVFNYKPMSAIVLEPPGKVKVVARGRKLQISWEPPELARVRPDLVADYAFYVGDEKEPLAVAGPDKTSIEVELPPKYDATALSGRMTTRLAQTEGAPPKPVESEGSDDAKPATVPAITSLTPSTGQVGTAVTIAGSGFGPTRGRVAFNGVDSAIARWNDTEIRTTVPQGATSGDIRVFNDAGQSAGATFEVVDLLALLRKSKYVAVAFDGDHAMQVPADTELVDYFVLAMDTSVLAPERLAWNGEASFSFSGEKTDEDGTRYRISVSGNVDASGTRIESITAESSARAADMSTDLKLTLKDIPFTSLDGDGMLTFELAGPDVRSHVAAVSLRQGTQHGTFTYLSTNWSSGRRPARVAVVFGGR